MRLLAYALIQHNCVHIRKKNWTQKHTEKKTPYKDTQTQKEDGHVTTETEIGVMHVHVKEC